MFSSHGSKLERDAEMPMSLPLTVGMTPAFLYEGDWLLRAQLRCLSEQECKDFDVLLVDAQWSKRKDYIPELAAHYKLRINHVPYKPNTHIAKRLDCSIFNAAYCYSESPRIVRYSCWRFVRPDFTKVCIESKTNVDFRFHNVAPSDKNRHPQTDHNTDLWNFGSDEVHWDKMPRAGQPEAHWLKSDELDAPPSLMSKSCFGNYMIFRDQWLSINGCDEVFTNAEHWEDQDFCLRARNAGFQCSHSALRMLRSHHWYGGFSGRANTEPDHQFKRPCELCDSVNIQCKKPNRYDLKRRQANGEVEIFEENKIWVCTRCLLSGPVFYADENEYTFYHLEKKRIVQANVIPKYKIGRRLRILAGDMDGKSLPQKAEVFNDSWANQRYYQ